MGILKWPAHFMSADYIKSFTLAVLSVHSGLALSTTWHHISFEGVAREQCASEYSGISGQERMGVGHGGPCM